MKIAFKKGHTNGIALLIFPLLLFLVATNIPANDPCILSTNSLGLGYQQAVARSPFIPSFQDYIGQYILDPENKVRILNQLNLQEWELLNIGYVQDKGKQLALSLKIDMTFQLNHARIRLIEPFY